MSNSTSRAGRKRAIWRQSSAPIEPPAPVTSTTRLPSQSARPALSSTTGSRPSRSSSSTLRIVVSARRPLIRSSYDGTVSASRPVRRADLGDAPAHAVRRRRQRDDHLAHAEFRRPMRQVGDRPQHVDVAQQPAVLGRVVVEQADDAPLPAARELLRQPRAGLAGADDQHRLAQRGERAVEPVLLPDPVGEAVAGHQEDQHDRIEDQHAARHDRLQLQHHQHERDQQRAEARGDDDPLQVDGAREAPQPAVEPEREEDRRLQRDHPARACSRHVARGRALGGRG